MTSTRCLKHDVRHLRSLMDNLPMPTRLHCWGAWESPLSHPIRQGMKETQPHRPHHGQVRLFCAIWITVTPSNTSSNLRQIDWWWRNWCDPRQIRSHPSRLHHQLGRIRGDGKGRTKVPYWCVQRSVVLRAVRASHLLRTSDDKADSGPPPRHIRGQLCRWYIGYTI